MYYKFNLVLDSITSKTPQSSVCFSTPPILNHINPKVFYLSQVGCNTCLPVIWVEGIGNLSNPFHPYVSWSSGHLGDVLLCHYDEVGVRDYHFIYCYEPESCHGPIVSVNDAEITNVKIYPNPVNDKLVITSEIPLQRIEIYSSTGVLLKKYYDTKNLTINTTELMSGILYVLIFSENGKVTTSKIVKY
jgi:Secretion system C-terminal sorting domain